MRPITRRDALRVLSTGACLAANPRLVSASALATDSNPPLAPGAPNSPERLALIDAFKKQSEGLEGKYEARTYKGAQQGDWVMPYRLFKPEAQGKLPLVVYLHGSGGLGDDNEKQLTLGNTFGTRIWLLPENQKAFPCYVVAPQTDRGWSRYDEKKAAKGVFTILPGLGDGSRMALEVIDALRRDFPIDDRRIYVTGQSMGGAGAWNMLTYRPNFFAAAVICCGSVSPDDGTGSVHTPLWNFHGEADQAVPVSSSRDRIAARRKAGGQPLYTEYAGVDHNVWQWAYTEPNLPPWLFSQHL